MPTYKLDEDIVASMKSEQLAEVEVPKHKKRFASQRKAEEAKQAADDALYAKQAAEEAAAAAKAMEVEAKKLEGDAEKAKQQADDANKKAGDLVKKASDLKKPKPAGPPGMPSELGGSMKPKGATDLPIPKAAAKKGASNLPVPKAASQKPAAMGKSDLSQSRIQPQQASVQTPHNTKNGFTVTIDNVTQKIEDLADDENAALEQDMQSDETRDPYSDQWYDVDSA